MTCTDNTKEETRPPMLHHIDTTTPGYIYQTVADHLAHRIESGELKPNQPIPNERRLADEYGVSLGTARRATELLRGQQLVVTIRSKGSYVTDRNRQTAEATDPLSS
jgi:GntR family transcriptional regulator